MNKLRLKSITVFALTISFFVLLWIYAHCASLVRQEQGVVYYLHPGLSKKGMIAQLAQQGIIKHPLLAAVYLFPHSDAELKAGEYYFARGSTLNSIWRQINTGSGFVFHPYMIVPGWSFKQLRYALSQTKGLKHLIENMDDQQVMLHLGYPRLSSEGMFFPETYFYTRGTTDITLLKHALDMMQQKLHAAWQKRAPALPFKNQYQALVAASLVEKEAYLSEERPLIAGVLINRLQKNMLLQFDPTVIYGMGDHYQGKLLKRNLLENTSYNTYLHKNLPPTPIAMPSMASIQAVLHPATTDYLYFVAKGDGSHQFSKTLQEHYQAVQMFNKERAKGP